MTASIPRLSQEELTPELTAMLRPGIERLGYLGEFFKCAAHQPAALMSFMAFSEDLRHALSDRLIETVALTVTTADRLTARVRQSLKTASAAAVR